MYLLRVDLTEKKTIEHTIQPPDNAETAEKFYDEHFRIFQEKYPNRRPNIPKEGELLDYLLNYIDTQKEKYIPKKKLIESLDSLYNDESEKQRLLGAFYKVSPTTGKCPLPFTPDKKIAKHRFPLIEEFQIKLNNHLKEQPQKEHLELGILNMELLADIQRMEGKIRVFSVAAASGIGKVGYRNYNFL